MGDYMEDGLLSVEKANRMKAETDAYYYQNFLEVLAFVDSISEEHHLKDVQQIPFTWMIYRKRPQVRYTLAAPSFGRFSGRSIPLAVICVPA